MPFEQATANEKTLRENTYPGRGIVIGQSDKGHVIQVYWIMGRSVNSRNRIFALDGDFVRTLAFDESKLEDPSLIIYYPAKDYEDVHIISNGDQTDTIYNGLMIGSTFEEALMSRTFEPDQPNYTPRISGMIDLNDEKTAYKLAILKSTTGSNPQGCQRSFYIYEKAIHGFGHCIHTYSGDGNPLPSFECEPYFVALRGSGDAIAEHYWNLLNPENRVSLMVKEIEPGSKKARIRIINANK